MVSIKICWHGLVQILTQLYLLWINVLIFIKIKFGSSIIYFNAQQASTSHRNLVYILLLKGKGIASGIDTNSNEL